MHAQIKQQRTCDESPVKVGKDLLGCAYQGGYNGAEEASTQSWGSVSGTAKTVSPVAPKDGDIARARDGRQRSDVIVSTSKEIEPGSELTWGGNEMGILGEKSVTAHVGAGGAACGWMEGSSIL